MSKKSIIGGYYLDKLISKGVTAKVYRVYRVKNSICGKVCDDCFFALKAVPKKCPVANTNPVNKEYAIIKSLKHPNIVKPHKLILNKQLPDQEGYWDCMVLDYGVTDLYEEISKRGYLEESICKIYFRQMLSAIDYLHSMNIIHSDVKCENFIITEYGILKLVDFGFSQPFDPTTVILNNRGTPMYGAPEQIFLEYHKPWTVDIWALGCCLYAMATGYLPFSMSPDDLFSELRTGLIYSKDNSIALCKLISSIFVDHRFRPTTKQLLSHSWVTT